MIGTIGPIPASTSRKLHETLELLSTNRSMQLHLYGRRAHGEMKVRLVLRCPRCGSLSFRPSTLRRTRDVVFRTLGLHPQRCYSCRSRFYSFRLASLRSALAVLEGPRPKTQEPEPAKPDAAAASGDSSQAMRWKATRNRRF